MVALISLLVVLSLSFLITRTATVALTLTGMSPQLARMQAVSAYTGVGFTTTESEYMVKHPLRRRILLVLMILGNAGIVTAVSSLILSFTGLNKGEGLYRLAWLAGGIALLWIIATSSFIERQLSRFIRWALRRWTRLEVRDYASLLHLTDDFSVIELSVRPDDWVAHQTLEELDLPAEGITVLGIQRGDDGFVGVPRGHSRIEPGDRLILYGRSATVDDLRARRMGRQGEHAHRRATEEHQIVLREQDAVEQQRTIRAHPGRAADDDPAADPDDEAGARGDSTSS